MSHEEGKRCKVDGCKGERILLGRIPHTNIRLYGCANPKCKNVTWEEGF